LAEMAKLRLDEKAYEQVIKLGEEALLFEDTPETRVEIAMASLYAGKPAEAAKHASAAVAVDPQNALAWKIKGEGLLESRDYPGASEAFMKALELKRDVEPLYALGTAQLGMGEREKAAEIFAQFLAQIGDRGASRLLVGRAYQGHGLPQEAEGEFQKALLLDPRTPNANYFWAISILQGNGNNPTAEVYSHLRAELKLNPRHFEANYMLGSLASTARNDAESDRFLHLAAEIKPSAPETWVLLGLNAQRRKSEQEAIACFRKAIERGKNLDPKNHFELRKAYFGLGRLLIASGRTKEGEELLGKAKELQVQMLAENRKKFPTTQEGRSGMGGDAPYIPEAEPKSSRYGELASLKGETAEQSLPSKLRGAAHARTDLQGKEEAYLGEVLGASFNDLATAEALEQKYQQAFDHYREAARWSPKIPGLQRNLGLAAYFASKPDEAVRLLSKVVTEAPGDAQARAVLGLAYFASGKFAQAVKTLRPLGDRTTQDPELGFAWAKSLAETGNKEEAKRALQNIGKEDAKLSVAQLIQFGELCRQLGQMEQAKQLFHRALTIEPDNAEAKCALQLGECP